MEQPAEASMSNPTKKTTPAADDCPPASQNSKSKTHQGNKEADVPMEQENDSELPKGEESREEEPILKKKRGRPSNLNKSKQSDPPE